MGLLPTMELPSIIQRLLKPKTNPKRVIYASLILDVDAISGAIWTIDVAKVPNIKDHIVRNVPKDSWDERIRVCDSILATLEDTSGLGEIHNVVLGMPSSYLSESGEIQPSVRLSIKKFAEVLDITPLGFVPLYQAIAYKFKQDEGVPTNAILISLSGHSFWVYLYKVGKLAGVRRIEYGTDVVTGVEEALTSFVDVEVLPSRMLLYGSEISKLEEMRALLLRHPWQTKANFLHFPKIEVLPAIDLITAVSIAGASELTSILPDDGDRTVEVLAGQGGQSPVAGSRLPGPLPVTETSSLPNSETPTIVPQDELTHENVTVVDPEALGFRKNADILETSEKEQTQIVQPDMQMQEEEKGQPVKPRRFRNLKLPHLSLSTLKLPAPGIVGVIIAIFLAVAGVVGFIYWMFPSAVLTVYATPKQVEASQKITIDPGAPTVDSSNFIIPGKTMEKSVNGDKTIPVTGKKKVGDPAKGKVTIYNKSFFTKVLKKGTILTANSLRFTLDDDVTIASASENLAQTQSVYGKVTVNITAETIGPEGNLPAGTTFLIGNVDKDDVTGRSDQTLSGGNSHDATVVTRTDYDSLTKALSSELIEKTKKELTDNVATSERLISETIKTAVVDKSFAQELDQEAKQLTGKLTISVSGVAYRQDDIVTLLEPVVQKSIPPGYTLSPTQKNVEVSQLQVKKDGKITGSTTFKGLAVPVLDTEAIKKEVTGKSIVQVQEYLKRITGVGGVGFTFRFSPWKDRLPINSKNISITVALQE